MRRSPQASGIRLLSRTRAPHPSRARAYRGACPTRKPKQSKFRKSIGRGPSYGVRKGKRYPRPPLRTAGRHGEQNRRRGRRTKKKRHRKLQKQYKPDTEKPLVFIQCFKRHSTLLEWRHGALTATHRNETQTATRGRASQNNNGQQRAARAARRMRSTGTDAERSAQGVVRPCSAGFCWVDPWARAQIEKS